MIFQTFALSDEPEVTIESVPMRVGNEFKPVGLMEPYRIKLSVTREGARSVMKSLLQVDSFGELFPPVEPGSDLCLPADRMTGAMYNDQGPPTLDRVIAALKASK